MPVLDHIVFPASLPGVFTGIWYGLKNALQGVLIFELFPAFMLIVSIIAGVALLIANRQAKDEPGD